MEDRKLRDMLSRGYIDGGHLRTVARRTFGIDLVGPPPEWSFPAEKEVDRVHVHI